MARSHLRHTVRDRAGNVVQNALCNVYTQGTTTAVSDMYAAASGGSTITTLTSNSQGEIEAWFTYPKFVDIKVTDNTDTAYYPSDASSLLSWSSFTETVEVVPPPATVTLKAASAEGDLWVSVNGSDSNDGLSMGSAKLTVGGALTAAGSASAKVKVGPGTFDFSATIAPPVLGSGGFLVAGWGNGATELHYTGSGWAASLGDGGATDTRWTFLEDLSLTGTASALGGVKFNHARFCGMRRMRVEGFTHASGIGASVLGSVSNYFHKFDHVQFRDCTTGLKLDGTGGVGANSCHVVDCHFGVHTTAIHMDAPDSCLIERTELNGSITTGVRIENGAVKNVLFLVSFDGPVTPVTGLGAGATDNAFIYCPGLATKPTGGTRTIYIGEDGIDLSGDIETIGRGRFGNFAGARSSNTGLGVFGNSEFENDLAVGRNLFLDKYAELTEMSDPSAPAANKVRLYSKDNGAGKTQLVALFPTGAVQVIATEP